MSSIDLCYQFAFIKYLAKVMNCNANINFMKLKD